MRTNEIFESLLSQYDLDGIRVINNSTSNSISSLISNKFSTVGLMAVKKKDKSLTGRLDTTYLLKEQMLLLIL